MAAGFVASMVAFAVGGVLDFALTSNDNQHGLNAHMVSVDLLFVGTVGTLVTAIVFFATGPFRNRRNVVDDGSGNVGTREDSVL